MDQTRTDENAISTDAWKLTFPNFISLVIDKISDTRKVFFVQTTCIFTWLVCVIVSVIGLAIDSPHQTFYIWAQLVFFMGSTTVGLFALYRGSKEHLYWFLVFHVTFSLITFASFARLDEQYAEFFLPIVALECFFCAALLPAYPRPVIVTAALFWIGLVLVRYFVIPREFDLHNAWPTANILAFVAFGFAMIFYGLFTSLSNSVKRQNRHIKDLDEITAILNITMNESQFGLIGYETSGEKSFERGAKIDRLTETLEENINCSSLDGLKNLFSRQFDVDYAGLFENFTEIETAGKHFILHAYNLHDLTLISHMDVTELRRVENKLRQNQKLSLIGEITSGVAHNYNNALAIALSNLESIDRQQNPECWSQHIEPSIRAIEQSTDVSRKLIALAGRQKLKEDYFDLAEAVQNMRGLIRSALGSEVVLEILTDDALVICTDKNELESAILNLVINARNAMEVQTGRLIIKTYRKDDYAVVSVADNGHGVSEDIQEKIFDPFFSTMPSRNSSGLGLSIIKGFVEQSKGFVKLKSSAKGATFSLHFPISIVGKEAIPVEEILPEEEIKIGPNLNHQILVVDDNFQVASSFTRLLQKMGFDADFETSPLLACERILANPEVVAALIDLSMPEMDGVSLGQKIHQTRPDVRLYLITGDISSEKLNSLPLRRFEEVLLKPVHAKDLQRVANAALQRSQPKHVPEAEKQSA